MKNIGGVWLPDTEIHFQDMLFSSGEVEGKKTYQYKKLRAAVDCVPKERRKVCIDVGGHVGLWAMWLVKDFEHVHSFEPVNAHADIYPHNVNGSYTLHRVALGAQEGTVDMRVPLETTGNAHIAIKGRHPGTKHVPNPDRLERVESIPMKTLDSFDFADVGLIKIDVEGYELHVCKGAKETLLRERPVVIMEQKGNESAYGGRPNEATEYLQSIGMKMVRAIGGDNLLSW